MWTPGAGLWPGAGGAGGQTPIGQMVNWGSWGGRAPGTRHGQTPARGSRLGAAPPAPQALVFFALTQEP